MLTLSINQKKKKKKKIWEADFSSQFRNIIVSYKRIGYDLNKNATNFMFSS